VPCGAVTVALRGLLARLLGEREEWVDAIRKRLASGLGDGAWVLAPSLPELAALLGPQPGAPPAPAEVGPVEARNQLMHAFERLVGALASEEHPLVLFLDDLQWADAASLRLIELLATEPTSHHLLLIGSFRDDEVGPGHPLALSLASVRGRGVVPLQIELGPLSTSDVASLCEGALGAERGSCGRLAETLARKSSGNPFFLGQLLTALHDRGLVRFDEQAGCYVWDDEAIEREGVADNVGALLASRLERLPREARHALAAATCVGAEVALDVLSAALGVGRVEAARRLWPALEEGLLLPVDTAYRLVEQGYEGPVRYRFAHDRVQEAAHGALSPEARVATHLALGRALLSEGAADDPARLFALADHLGAGAAAMGDRAERARAAEIALDACVRAKAQGAYSIALRHARSGLAMLGERPFERAYRAALGLSTEGAEAAELLGKVDEAERLVAFSLSGARTLLDEVKPRRVRVRTRIASGDIEGGVLAGLELLDRLGHSLPARPTTADVVAAYARVRLLLRGRSDAQLLALPPMRDPVARAALSVLVSLAFGTYTHEPNLFALLFLRGVRVTLEQGASAEGAGALVVYGALLCGPLGDVSQGQRFGRLGVALLDLLGDRATRAAALFCQGFMIKPWCASLGEAIEVLLEGYRAGVESGDLEYALTCASVSCSFRMFQGDPLDALADDAERWADALGRAGLALAGTRHAMMQQLIDNLRGASPDALVLRGARFDVERERPMFERAGDNFAVGSTHWYRLQLLTLLGRHDEAVVEAIAGERYLGAAVGTVYTPFAVFHAALARLAVARRRPLAERVVLLARAEVGVRRFAAWARQAPSNFEAKARLLEAERARVLGDAAGAIDNFDRAIAAARRWGANHDTALACERAGRFQLGRGNHAVGEALLREARYAYSLWGASAKLAQLDGEFPLLVPPVRRGATTLPSSTSSTRSGSEALDLASVIKASHAISGEIVLPRLLGRLLALAIENAGAQRGALVLARGNGFHVEAAGSPEGSSALTSPVPFESSDQVCRGAVRYVLRTGEPLLLDDVLAEGPLIHDPDARQRGMRSVLCAPIKQQGRLLGAIYLEHREATGAFTPARLEVLRLISTQAAISLENASLYASLQAHRQALEQQVDERTRELRASLQQVVEAQHELAAQLTEAAAYVRSLLPPPLDGPARSAWRFVPSVNLGGDAFGYQWLDEARLAVYLIDACGHGMASALLSIAALTSLSSRRLRGSDFGDPASVLSGLNEAFPSRTHGGLYLTAWYGVLDVRARTVRYASAGHPPALLVVPSGTTHELGTSGPMIGVADDALFSNDEAPLPHGARLVVISDGAYEVSLPDGSMLAYEAFEAALTRAASLPLDQLLDRMVAFARQAHGSDALEDDFSMVAIELPSQAEDLWPERRRAPGFHTHF
jgi:histidine kinase